MNESGLLTSHFSVRSFNLTMYLLRAHFYIILKALLLDLLSNYLFKLRLATYLKILSGNFISRNKGQDYFRLSS